MLRFVWHATRLFLRGKLIRNPRYFYQQLAYGFIIGLSLLVGLDKMEVNLALAVGISSLMTGMLMPFLLKDIKMQ